MERITSRRNAIARRFRELARTPAGGGDVLLDGEHLVQEALACAVPIEVAAVAEPLLDAPASGAAALARDLAARGGRVFAVSNQVLAAISPVRQPSGIVAIATARPAPLDRATDGASPLVVVIAGVQDPGNVGAILRSAAAFGATGAIVLDGCANPFGWKALRGAMGATFRLPVASAAERDALSMLQERRIRLIATAAQGGMMLPQADLCGAVAVALGGEGAGVPPSIVRAAGETITIPMQRPVDSLNVATAGALILYEAARQRRS